MQVKDILHPADEKALTTLRRLPLFDRFVRKVMEYGGESYCKGENLGCTVRVTKSNFPQLYPILEETCQEVGIAMPEVYVYNDPVMNAYTYGETRPFVAISNSLIERLDPDEFKCVFAHECGHILCKHTLYNTMVAIITDLADDFGIISGAIYAPLQMALQYWSRKSELSADRCAAAVCGEETFQRSMLKLTSGVTKIVGSPYQLVEQAKEYMALQKASWWMRIQQNCRVAWESHPQMCLRAYEIDRWSHSPIYRRLQHEPIV